VELEVKMRVVFDVDDTLWKVRPHHGDQVPDYDLIQVLRWHVANRDGVYVWSAGGTEYAYQIMHKLGLDDMVQIVQKTKETADSFQFDISYDDEEITLAKVNVRVNRDADYYLARLSKENI